MDADPDDMENLTPNDTMQSGPRLKVIGVGRAGMAVVNLLLDRALAGAEFIGIGTELNALNACRAERKLLLESKRLRGLGTGGDPHRGTKAAEENIANLKALCEGAEVVFILAGLGGGTGTGVAPVLARTAREGGALVLSFVFTPFECEGETRALHATRGLEALKAAADGVVCLPNQKIFHLIDENTSVAETFDRTGKLLADGVRAVWRLMSLKGPLEINFEDLCSVLKDRHAENVFAVAEGSGTERVTEVLERLRTHPMFDDGNDLAHAEAVLVSLVGGPELSMAEINRVMSDIKEHCLRARVAMGAATLDEFAGRLTVTVIAACPPKHHLSGVDQSERECAGVPGELFPQILDENGRACGQSRFTPPPPELSPERIQQAARQTGRRKPLPRLRQGQLPLEVISKGRFEKAEPTVLHGEDLDIPTYVRRGVALN